MIMGQGRTMKVLATHKTIKIMLLLYNNIRKILIIKQLPKHTSLLNLPWIKVKWASGYPVPVMLARVKQYPPVHQKGWMVSGQETVLCSVPVPIMLNRLNQYPPVNQEGWMVTVKETIFRWVPVRDLTRVVGLDASTTCLGVLSR
jgi:hypothetical protein